MLRLGIDPEKLYRVPSYARTAYVVAIWPSFLFDSFVKIWATCQIFLGKWFTAPPGKKFPVRPLQITVGLWTLADQNLHSVRLNPTCV